MRILDPISNDLSLGTDEYSDTIGIVFKTDEEIGAPQLGVIIPKFMLGYTFKNGEFSYSELTPSYVQKLYPDYKIIKISEFKNNSITINKKFMKKQKVLLLNDTANSFYKYNYEPSSVDPSYIKQFVEISHKGKIIFSHYGDDTVESPALKIYVKNKF